MILPVDGITTTRPGSSEDADAETRDPRGRGSDICFEGYGRANVNVSGEGVLAAYGQTTAWE